MFTGTALQVLCVVCPYRKSTTAVRYKTSPWDIIEFVVLCIHG